MVPSVGSVNMIEPICARSFYPPTDFTPPLLKPSRARAAALRALRQTPLHIFRHFSAQQPALDFCDANPQHRLRLWSLERDDRGRRSFIASSYEGFWRVYARLLRRGICLHFYEVIRECYAAKFYLDLEFAIALNAEKRPEEMVDAVVRAVGEVSGIRVERGGDGVVELDSTTEQKFSRHLIFQDVVFHDNVQAGDFARRVVEQMAAHDAQHVLVSKTDGQVVPFVDLGVYTRNRCFRLVGSSKFGKARRLLVMGAAPDGRVAVSKELFMRSLVCSVKSGVRLLGSVAPMQRLDARGENAMGGAALGNSGSAERREVRSSSPYPVMDDYVRAMISGAGGGIHGVTVLASSDVIVYAIKGGYKYCANVGRHHKSNNVVLVADLCKGEMFQRCFDPDCRGYRSPSWLLPPPLRQSTEEVSAYIDDDVDDDSLNGIMDRLESGSKLEVDEVDYSGGVDDAAFHALLDTPLSSATPQR